MPLVVNGVLYTTTPLNLVFALDAVTGREQQVLDKAFKYAVYTTVDAMAMSDTPSYRRSARTASMNTGTQLRGGLQTTSPNFGSAKPVESGSGEFKAEDLVLPERACVWAQFVDHTVPQII